MSTTRTGVAPRSDSISPPAALAPSSRPMRADARRNYDALLVAAEDAFAAQGAEASLEEIARAAGVGIGTLYRHFPTRQELLEAVYLRRVDELWASADARLGASDPFGAFADWLRDQMVFGRRGRCVAASVMAAKMQEGTELNTAVARMRTAGEALLARAQVAGVIRSEVAVIDILRMVHGILLVNEHAPDSEAQSARMLELVVAGLRP